ncbi:MAG: hypothetical protein COY38_03660 [Candidatus Aenigmarchaeota archaeon CG_4_10_14_0_8_um_filter_37_24]|nr:hypothetical protein [Candidatus Aenigmarchaeota archaeon]OIN88480.1 MAG: hypothetical protein AUJ50_00755 [Candidatus Aenigmarchaeota archaeon CG1_02_38_14]OIP32441.1 MAG: hypothetical protein AUK23_04280 [Deltaproteobacteria bacterium CG2_30_43_15]PIV68774.1 MAG: hypothetical protein COS07_03000 [Candidatus Aenigmarchaeota archaeon CG01_land_8_20_14_3_00_37_9]PIY35963.1 MAG: hypothetical protein COZ04_01735 [Candidatus Aenigmarchaeota archaeon CG_4_10_14_3_um_filter_37_21]PIZ34742.1 MAG: 
MRLEYHLAASAALSILFYLLTESILGSVSLILVGVFIDLDHFIDYWIAKKRISFDFKDFFDYFYAYQYKKASVLFHSVEFIPIIALAGFFLFGKLITYGVLVGFISHIILDYIGNETKPLTYSLVYRTWKRFDVSCFHDERREKKAR